MNPKLVTLEGDNLQKRAPNVIFTIGAILLAVHIINLAVKK